MSNTRVRVQVKKQGMPPGPRAGFSMCVHKKRAILFGGVVDTEDKGWCVPCDKTNSRLLVSVTYVMIIFDRSHFKFERI